ncbi:MAG: tetratricopeptide repeat protein [Verrucomicrobia bacterium]|nr:tetratricopeptide repeat protein [Verrucomicrobiota bacterium]
MTDESKKSPIPGPKASGAPAGQAPESAESSSELDDLLQAIDAAAGPEDAAAGPEDAASTLAAEDPTERVEIADALPADSDNTVADTEQPSGVPGPEAASDKGAAEKTTASDGANRAAEAMVTSVEPQGPVDRAPEERRPAEARKLAAAPKELADTVEVPSPQGVASNETPVEPSEAERVNAARAHGRAGSETQGGVTEAGDEAVVGTEVGTSVEPVPLAAAEAQIETQQRRRRRLLYVLVPVLAVGLAAALTQVRLGGGVGTPPAMRNWEHGSELVKTGNLADGLEMLENVVSTTPLGMKRTFAHARLAEVYAKLGATEPHYLNGAIRHYSAVLREVIEGRADAAALPVDELLYKTGRCFADLGSNETAIEHFEQIDREHPDSPLRTQARLDLAASLMAAGEYQRARQTLAELADAHRGEPVGEHAFFLFAESFDRQAQSLEREP